MCNEIKILKILSSLYIRIVESSITSCFFSLSKGFLTDYNNNVDKDFIKIQSISYETQIYKLIEESLGERNVK